MGRPVVEDRERSFVNRHPEIKMSVLAKKIGCSRSTLSKWKNGQIMLGEFHRSEVKKYLKKLGHKVYDRYR